MPVKVKIKEYLDTLTENQVNKPLSEKRPVPTITDFARAAGVSRQTMHYFVTQDHKLLNLQYLSIVLSVLRGYGFDVKLTDLLVYDPD